MTSEELLEIVSCGETSTVQFKERMPYPDSIAAELIAFSNSKGGIILFGVNDKTGGLNGLSFDEIRELNQRIVNIASAKIYPPVYVATETVSVDNQKIVVITVDEGLAKPYKDANGTIYVKNGADKRKVTSNEEIARLLGSRSLAADETLVFDSSIEDLDTWRFREYFEKEFGASIESRGLTMEKAAAAKKVMRDGHLTLAGLLFFGKTPQHFRPAFCIKAVTFIGNSIGGNDYRSKPEDFSGPIPELYRQGMQYLKSSIKYLQKEDNFNARGVPEISIRALDEVLQNALTHRDYYKNAPVRILLFDNRIEIISPGKLPNSLTVEEARYGNPVIRNNQIAYFASRTMPYTGLGSGLCRAFNEQPDMELVNDAAGDQFIVTFPRV
jgi:predicted HTH transcriptional regulator